MDKEARITFFDDLDAMGAIQLFIHRDNAIAMGLIVGIPASEVIAYIEIRLVVTADQSDGKRTLPKPYTSPTEGRFVGGWTASIDDEHGCGREFTPRDLFTPVRLNRL